VNKDYTPYEIPTAKPERPLRILFLTDSLGEEIKNSNPIVEKLKKLSEFRELEIWFSPTQDADLQGLTSNIIKNNSCEYTLTKSDYPYEHFIASACFNYGECYCSTFVRTFADSETPPDLFATAKHGQINQMELDIIHKIGDTFFDWDWLDLVVVHQDDLASLTDMPHVVSLDGMVERIRLFMLNYRLFYVEKWFKTCEISYYAHRRLKMFPNMKHLWSLVSHLDDEWVQSLYTRTELYLRAIDKLKINALRQPNHVVATQYEYDFAFLILLVTGIFDNLAWLICKMYGLNLDKMDIKLIKDKKHRFLNAVQNACPDLHDFLSEELSQAKIDLVYPIRDAVVHRNYLTTVYYQDAQKKIDAVYLKVSPDISQKFDKLTKLGMSIVHCFKHDKVTQSTVTDAATGSTTVHGPSEDMYIIPHEFTEMIDDMIRGLINSIIGIVVASRNGGLADNGSTGIFDFFGKEIESLYF